MSAQRLTSEHAEQLAAMERAYPLAMRQGEATIRARLELLEQSRFNFSWALFHGSHVTGYIVAYPSKSMVESHGKESIIYVDDLQVLPGHNSDLYRLIKLMVEDKEAAELGHLRIEALARRSASRVMADHPQVITRLGYELIGTYDYWDDNVGESLTWMSWAPLPAAAVKSTSDQLHFSSDLLQELELEF